MRIIIIDGVFNHVGIPFWAFQRARAEGPSSRFTKWFHLTRWDDPSTEADEFDYQRWAGIRDLPEFRKGQRGHHPEVKAHFRFLAPGTPYVYYGDEVGMWAADDPDCRKPMVWPDLSYEAERAHPFGLSRPVNSAETISIDTREFVLLRQE